MTTTNYYSAALIALLNRFANNSFIQAAGGVNSKAYMSVVNALNSSPYLLELWNTVSTAGQLSDLDLFLSNDGSGAGGKLVTNYLVGSDGKYVIGSDGQYVKVRTIQLPFDKKTGDVVLGTPGGFIAALAHEAEHAVFASNLIESDIYTSLNNSIKSKQVLSSNQDYTNELVGLSHGT